MSLNAIPMLVALLLAATPALAASGWAGPRPGDHVRVKVRGSASSGFVARRIERGDDVDPDEELRGRIESFDPESRRARLLGLPVVLEPAVRVLDESGNPLRYEDLRSGLRVKADLRRDAGAGLTIRKIKIRDDQRYDERRIVGTVEEILWSRGRPSGVRLLGVEVEIDDSTDYAGFPEMRTPSLIRTGIARGDDDDLQLPGAGPPDRLLLAGEVRARVESFDNADGDAAVEDREVEGKISAILGLVADLGPLSAFVKLDAEREYSLVSSDRFRPPHSSVRIDEFFIEAPGIVSPHLTIVAGRQKFDEYREWWYRTSNLDAVRLLAGWRRVSGELSVSRMLYDSERSPGDHEKRNTIGVLRWHPREDLRLEAYWVDRRDVSGGSDSPRTSGLRVAGEGWRRLEYRIDVASQRGTRERIDEIAGTRRVRPIDAEAMDARLTFRPRVAGDPTLTVGYAFGSGDPTADLDPAAQPEGTDRSFRQTGLHRNRGKDNGNVSFRYYGEVLDPELTNLRIVTAAVGVRPRRAISLDVLYHRYRQDVASEKLRHVDIDADPEGRDPYLGEAFDLAFGYEPDHRLEIRLTAGIFRPGKAFAGDVSDSLSARLQLKLRF